MPVGFSSPARNLFLLGSQGGQVVTNFFKTINQFGVLDFIRPEEIRFNSSDEKFILAGSANDDAGTKQFGWLEKRSQAGTAEWDVRVEATSSGVNTTLRAMELDSNDNLIVVGKTADIPWIAKYSNGGVIDWQSTTNSADVEYTGVTSDSNGQYYACGNTPDSGEAQAFVEKFDASGNPGWGKSAFMLGRDVVLNKIAANSRGEVVAVGYLEDDSKFKGYIVKIDTNTGEVLWDRTLETDKILSGPVIRPCLCEDVYIDSKDQIYVVGRLVGIGYEIGFIAKYTAEGNMIWQRETPDDGKSFSFYQVKSDGETEQTIVLGRYNGDDTTGYTGVLSKYSKNGSLVWRRKFTSSFGSIQNPVNLDADSAFYYLLYTDEATNQITGNPDKYTFGKVSSSGNGLGAFEYSEGTGRTIDYEILNVQDGIGRLSDGSVRNDTSDLITYPFNANKLLFDDLATQITNKKRQMDGPDSFEYSGSPAIRPADFQELNLLGENVSGRIWTDTSGKGNNGVASLTSGEEPFSGAGSVSFGTGDYLTTANSTGGFSFGTGDFTIEFWINSTQTTRTDPVGWNYSYNSAGWAGFIFNISSSGDMAWYENSNSRISASSTGWNNGSWNHVSLTRSGNSVRMFLNGSQVGSTYTTSFTYGAANSGFIIGKLFTDPIYLNGFISNLRIIKGTALYTSNFTPPTTPLTAISGTELLTCQGNTIADASANNFTITVNGNAAPTSSGPTHNAAGYWEFDGVNDYITTGITAAELLGIEFTVEAWINPSSFANSVNEFLRVDKSSGVRNWGLYVNSSGQLRKLGTGGDQNSSYGTLSTNTWYHIVMNHGVSSNQGAFSLSFYSIYLNGTLVVGGDNDDYDNVNAFGNLVVGNSFAGKIGEVRVYPRALTAAQVFQNYNATKTKYTNEAPDTAPKISTDGIVYGSNLLLNYDFGNRACYERTNQNLVPYSQGDDWISNWTNVSATILSTTERSPVGTNDAVKYTGTGFYLDVSMTSGNTYVWSLYVKVVDAAGDTIKVGHGASQYGSAGNFRANIRYNLSDFSAEYDTSLNNAYIYDAVSVGDGWYRIGGKAYKGDTNQGQFEIYIGNMNATVIVWGPQLEEWSGIGDFESNPPKASRYFGTTGTTVNNVPTTVKNLSSTSYTGTINGATFNPAGYFEFNNDGTTMTDWIEVPSFTGFPGGNNSYSYSFWMRTNFTDSTDNPEAVFFYGNEAQGEAIRIRVGGAGNLTVGHWGGAGYDWSTNTGIVSSNTWHHICETYDGTTNQNIIYVDGTQAQTPQTINNLSIPSSATLYLGRRVADAADYNGDIGGLLVYNRKLFASEVSQNFYFTRSKYGV